MTDDKICRDDGRCEYAIQSGAEVEGHCPNGKCAMPQPTAHLTIPGALEWDGDNGTHSADGESREHGESAPTPIGDGSARLMRAYDLGEFADEGGSATVEAMSCESFDNITAERPEHEFDSYAAGYQQAMYEQAAPLLHEVNRLKSFRASYMEWSDKTDWVQASAQPRELGKHRADVIVERFDALRAQLANTEQSRRSFFDLSQDLEKRLAEFQRVLGGMLFAYDDGVGRDWSAPLLDHARTLCPAVEFVPIHAKCESCGDWGHIETEDSAHDCPECGPSVVERAVEAGVMNAPKPYAAMSEAEAEEFLSSFGGGSGNKAKRRIAAIEKAKAESFPCWSCSKPVTMDERASADGDCPHCAAELDLEDWPKAKGGKPKICIECDQPYCPGVCVERGDQDYDRDQAAKGGCDE